MANEPNAIWCTYHKDMAVTLVCLQYVCVKNALMCQACIEERHDGHPYISLTKMKTTMIKFKSKKRELTKENIDKARRIKGLFQESYDCFQQLIAKMKRLSEFMDSVEQNLLFNNDEYDVAKDVLSIQLIQIFFKDSLNDTGDVEKIHKKFDLFFRNFQITSKNHSEIAIRSFQEQKNTFSGSLRGQVDIVFREFESFLSKMQLLEKKYRQFSKPKNEVTEEQRNIEFGKQQLTPFYMNQMKLQQNQQKMAYLRCQKYPGNIEEEQNYSMNIIEKQMNNNQEAPEGPRKLVFKLYSYLIFYFALECDAFVPEPVLGGVVLKKVESGELKMPIRCLFCRQVRIKSFVEFYFRFELTTRFGKLCLFRIQDTISQQQIDIYAHEMCLLWSNIVVVNHETRSVEVPTITYAAQDASQMICNYCQLTGASTKCADQSCQVAFHFNCLKQMKLVGIKLDPDTRYRYYCDGHSTLQRSVESSDWFMSRAQVQNVLEQIYDKKQMGEEDHQARKRQKPNK